jgi:homoserine kinase
VFRWLKQAGHIEDVEFCRTWNTGLGMVLVVGADQARMAADILQEQGEKVYTVGSLVEKATEDCTVRNMEVWG